MKPTRYTAACLALALAASLLSSCRGGELNSPRPDGGTNTPATGNTATESATVTIGGTVIEPSTGDASVTAQPETAPETIPVEDPTEGAYTPAGETVILLGETVTVEGQGVTVNGSTVTIVSAGTYLISGTANGQIIVDTADESKVTLLLNGASLSCADGPAVFVRSAPK